MPPAVNAVPERSAPVLPSLLLVATWCLFWLAALRVADASGEEWPSVIKKITYVSSADTTEQPALFYAPASDGPKSLLVALHTWSIDYLQESSIVYAKWCIEHDWVFIHPNFRGPNVRPEATGSELVIKDVLSAVDYAKQKANVDVTRIYLVGTSGGGYLALLMAGRAPGIWAGVSAWVPIADLQAWYYESRQAGSKYAQKIVASCGGIPEKGSAAELECKKRSPLTYLERAATLPVDINAGIQDGHTGPVPISHSLHAFNLLAAKRDRITESDIAYFVKEVKVPSHLQSNKSYPPYGQKKILFRRQSRQARITIFDGGHEIEVDAALHWLAQQSKSSPSKPSR